MTNPTADKLFRDLHPGVLPKHGTAAQWQAVATLAFKNQGDIVDVSKRHTSRSRFWGRLGDAALLQRDQLALNVSSIKTRLEGEA